MIGQETVLALVPARGGSKAVPRKNVRHLGGKPLIAWAIAAAQQSAMIDRTVVSSDDAEIIATAQSYGCESPFLRPAALASDTARTIDVAHHLLRTLDQKYDYLVLLQPTSPFVTAGDIDACVRLCAAHGASSCVSVRPAEEHPAWMYEIGANGLLVPFLPGGRPKRRQELAPAFLLNGAVFVARCDWLLTQNDFLGADTLAYVMPAERSVDIDTEEDFAAAETLIEQGRHAAA